MLDSIVVPFTSFCVAANPAAVLAPSHGSPVCAEERRPVEKTRELTANLRAAGDSGA